MLVYAPHIPRKPNTQGTAFDFAGVSLTTKLYTPVSPSVPTEHLSPFGIWKVPLSPSSYYYVKACGWIWTDRCSTSDLSLFPCLTQALVQTYEVLVSRLLQSPLSQPSACSLDIDVGLLHVPYSTPLLSTHLLSF